MINKEILIGMVEEDDIMVRIIENMAKEKVATTVYLNKETQDKLESVTEILNKNLNVEVSKSAIIETAVNDFLNYVESLQIMKCFQQGLPSIDHLVLVFTSSNENDLYEQRFHGKLNNGKQIKKRWSAIALGNRRIELINSGVIRYISLYRGIPDQGCYEFAEIDRIEKITKSNLAIDDPTENSGDIGKYRIYLKDTIITLPQKIEIGTAKPRAISRGKETTLRKLLTKKTIDQL